MQRVCCFWFDDRASKRDAACCIVNKIKGILLEQINMRVLSWDWASDGAIAASSVCVCFHYEVHTHEIVEERYLYLL